MSQRSRHHFLQRLFWNPAGAAFVSRLIRYERMFDTVVRGYSLITETNGERWLNSLLGSEPLVFDIGFHDGTSTDELLKLRPKAHVTGFDPSRFGITSYEKRFKNDTRVTFVNAALSNTSGTMEFYDYENMCNSLVPRKEMPGEKPVVYSVPVLTLDEYCHGNGVDRIDLMKIDAEGYDLHVLEGAKGLLARQSVDIFLFEFASGWAASKRYLWEAVEYVDPLPYRLFRLFNGFLCPVVYDINNDSCTTRPAMYVGVSESRLARADIPIRTYRF